ncbi:hypothetical protein WUBG_08068, partial [Wuchereria bancrofti]
HKTNGNNYGGNRYSIQFPPSSLSSSLSPSLSLSSSLSPGLSAIFTVTVTTTTTTTTTAPSNCMHLMDLRESDILDNSVDTEDARTGRHMEEQF